MSHSFFGKKHEVIAKVESSVDAGEKKAGERSRVTHCRKGAHNELYK